MEAAENRGECDSLTVVALQRTTFNPVCCLKEAEPTNQEPLNLADKRHKTSCALVPIKGELAEFLN